MKNSDMTFYKDSLYFLTCHIAYYMLLNFHINFVASKISNVVTEKYKLLLVFLLQAGNLKLIYSLFTSIFFFFCMNKSDLIRYNKISCAYFLLVRNIKIRFKSFRTS